MHCQICEEKAGVFRRRCEPCSRLVEAWEQNCGAGMPVYLSAFSDTGATRERIERFLAWEPNRDGVCVRDRIAADMTNQLLVALGQKPVQDADEVRRLRERGNWKQLGRPLEDSQKL